MIKTVAFSAYIQTHFRNIISKTMERLLLSPVTVIKIIHSRILEHLSEITTSVQMCVNNFILEKGHYMWRNWIKNNLASPDLTFNWHGSATLSVLFQEKILADIFKSDRGQGTAAARVCVIPSPMCVTVWFTHNTGCWERYVPLKLHFSMRRRLNWHTSLKL